MSSPHEMVHTATIENGAREWSCTRCSRRLLIRFPPHYAKLVLDPGDDSVSHVGGTGGLHVNTEVTPQLAIPGADERTWLAENGIDWDGELSA